MTDELDPKIPDSIKKESKPHLFCPGCGHPIALKNLGIVIDKLKLQEKSIIGFDIGCSLLAWDFFNIDSFQTHHGRSVPVMLGLKLAKPDKICVAYAGDGGAYAIGLQSLIWAILRNNPITVIVVNNTLYAMTGGQASPTTIPNEITDTTPSGEKNENVFMGPEYFRKIANESAYFARGIVTNPIQLQNYLQKALENQINNHSFSMVEVLSLCPVNWKTNAHDSLEFLENKMIKNYPLGEF
jgi:2-oxoglutarate ferredoxin oxidoreductase subunit beta